ncbi:MAG: hypothetical protein K6F75_08790, partial [Butyrivibrio sp.]|nr:hypothetical protein [Butyrivibrio sp.]
RKPSSFASSLPIFGNYQAVPERTTISKRTLKRTILKYNRQYITTQKKSKDISNRMHFHTVRNKR